MQSSNQPKQQERGRLATDERLRLRQAEMLLSVSRTIAAIDTLDEMLTTLVEIATREVNAERGTIFLYDSGSDELYSRVAQGDFQREIRILSNSGVAGHVYTTGEGAIVHAAYEDERFNPSVDEMTGYITKSILCSPIKTVKNEIIGVAQILNKKKADSPRMTCRSLKR